MYIGPTTDEFGGFKIHVYEEPEREPLVHIDLSGDTKEVCPNCGYCPTCKQGVQHNRWPQPLPWWQTPIESTTQTG